LGQQIANSPLFAPGWAAKVCMWLNSGPCAADDPEILRIAKNFEANNFDFLKLIKDVAMSPLTTYSAPTKTALQRGTVMTLARRDQFCQSMSARLGISDVCNLNGGQGDGNLQKIGSIISAYPADGYSRASVDLLQPTTANFMSRIGLENVCSYIAEAVVDTGAGQFQSKDPNQAIGQIVTQILGVLPPDDQPVVDLLTSHYNSAMGSDASATEALRSVFVLACLSPYVSQIGL